MTTAVDNIDDLEALLAGLDEDELNSLSIDDDVTDAVLVEEPVVAPPVKPKPKRKLKPLADTKPTVEPTSDADLEAELSDLDLDEERGVTTVTLNQDDEQKDLEHLGVATADEILAEARLIALMAGDKSAFTDEELLMLDQGGGLAIPNEASDEVIIKAERHVIIKPADDDMAIEALLAASTAAAPADPTASAPIKPKSTVRPTFSAVGPLKTFIDADKLQDDLNFTTTNISLAMTRQAALFAHYSRFAAEATYQSDRCKQQVDLLYANLDQQFRDSMTTAGTKFTEKTLESLIIKDTSYQEAQTRAHEARAIAKMVETTAESFKHRKDMLIQVGADLRQEKSGSGLVVREHPGTAATRNM